MRSLPTETVGRLTWLNASPPKVSFEPIHKLIDDLMAHDLERTMVRAHVIRLACWCLVLWMPLGRPRIITPFTTYTPINTNPHETAGLSTTFPAAPSFTVADCVCFSDRDHSCSISPLPTCRANHNRPSSASPESCATSSTNTTHTILKASSMTMPPIGCGMRVNVNTKTKMR